MGNAQHGLAWHRGHQAGIIDVIATLQEWGNVRIAKRLLKRYMMNEEGVILLD